MRLKKWFYPINYHYQSVSSNDFFNNIYYIYLLNLFLLIVIFSGKIYMWLTWYIVWLSSDLIEAYKEGRTKLNFRNSIIFMFNHIKEMIYIVYLSITNKRILIFNYLIVNLSSNPIHIRKFKFLQEKSTANLMFNIIPCVYFKEYYNDVAPLRMLFLEFVLNLLFIWLNQVYFYVKNKYNVIFCSSIITADGHFKIYLNKNVFIDLHPVTNSIKLRFIWGLDDEKLEFYRFFYIPFFNYGVCCEDVTIMYMDGYKGNIASLNNCFHNLNDPNNILKIQQIRGMLDKLYGKDNFKSVICNLTNKIELEYKIKYTFSENDCQFFALNFVDKNWIMNIDFTDTDLKSLGKTKVICIYWFLLIFITMIQTLSY